MFLALSAGVPTWLATSTLSTITGTLTVAKGGTGQTSFGQGWLNSDGTTMSASTSPTVNYIVATSTSATSTFPYLSVTTNSNVGTVVGGTWQGTAIGDGYLTKSGDWTGTLDTYEASSLLARANHTGTQGVSTLSNYDWTFSNNYGAINLTGSSTKPIWAQGGINASSTSNFVYASTTALTVAGNSYLGTVSSGTWNGTAISDAYIDDTITLTNLTQITNRAISDTTGTLTVARGGTGQTSFGQGWLNSDGTTLSASTSPTVNYIVATSTTATSTFPYLSVTTNSNVGTVVGGTWQGTAVGATYGGTGINSSALTGIAQIVAGTWSASSTLSTAFGGTGWNSIQANSILFRQRLQPTGHHLRRNGRLHLSFGERYPDLGGHLHSLHYYRNFDCGQRWHRSNFFRPRLAQLGRDDFVRFHFSDCRLPHRHINNGHFYFSIFIRHQQFQPWHSSRRNMAGDGHRGRIPHQVWRLDRHLGHLRSLLSFGPSQSHRHAGSFHSFQL